MERNEYRELSFTPVRFLTVAVRFVQLMLDSKDWLRVSLDSINSLLNVLMGCWTMMAFRRLGNAGDAINCVYTERELAACCEGHRGWLTGDVPVSMGDAGN
jgi:hypothetical protein